MAKNRLGILLGVGAGIVGILLLTRSAKADTDVPGPAGPQGPTGPQGPAGPQGVRGTILTSGDDVNLDAPADALEGDYFLEIPTGDLYLFEGGSWI